LKRGKDMAYMIPEFLGKKKRKEKEKSREGDAFDYFKDNLPENHICVYEPQINSEDGLPYHPDFIIFGENTGCIICEVKNWNWKRIIEEKDVRVREKTPFNQVRQHCFALTGHLKRHPHSSFFNNSGRHAGKLKFGAIPMIVFMGTTISMKKEMSELLNLSEKNFLTEEELSDKDILIKKIREVPRYFEEDLTFDTLMKAARTVVNTTASHQLKEEDMQKIKSSNKLDLYNQLREELVSVCDKIVNEEIIEKDSKYLKKIEAVGKELEQDNITIAAFGSIGGGKTTFLNALLRDAYLRMGMGETTKVLTFIKKPENDDQEGTAQIRYKTVDEISKEIKGIFDSLFIEIEDADIRKPEVREILRKNTKGNQFNDEVMDRYIKKLQTFLTGYEHTKEHLITEDELKSGNKSNIVFGDTKDIMKTIEPDTEIKGEKERTEAVSIYVRDVTLYNTNILTERGIVIIDSPGIGSNFERHTELAGSILGETDLAIMLSSIERPFAKEHRDFLRDQQQILRRSGKNENIIFVLTKIGKMPSNQDSLENIEDDYRNKLYQAGFDNPDIYKIDAETALWANKTLRGDTLSEKDKNRYSEVIGGKTPNPEEDLKLSKMNDFEESISNRLFDWKISQSLSTKLDRLEKTVHIYREKKKNELSSLYGDKKELEEKKSKLNKKAENADRRLRSYLQPTGDFDQILEERVYHDRIEKIAECADEIGNCIARTYAMNYYTKASLDPRTYAKWVISNADIEPIIASMRNVYEKRYITVRDRALENNLPALLSDDAPFFAEKLRSTNLEKTGYTEDLSYLEQIDLGFWQATKLVAKHIGNFFGEVFGKTEYDSQKEISQKVKLYINENYRDAFKDAVSRSVFNWIEKDRKEFSKQIYRSVDELHKDLLQEIKTQEDNLKLNEAQRKAKDNEINSYIKKTDTLLSQPRMQDLRRNINRLREESEQNPI
jgi:GTPase SAR1 family protein